jgi:tRNA (cmo5U34)-methyltransferase
VTEGWRSDTYLDDIRVEIPRYDELQERVVGATRGLALSRILELGVGTGETTSRLLDAHSSATLVGIDGNGEMLAAARKALPAARADLRLSRLEDPLPAGRFDAVVSVLAVHHLASEQKAELFARVAAALAPGGRFVLGDAVIPEQSEAVVPVEEDFDRPDRVDDQLSWLAAVELAPQVVWQCEDLAVLRADAQPSG